MAWHCYCGPWWEHGPDSGRPLLQRAKQPQASTGPGAAPLEHLPAALAQSYSAPVFQTSWSGFTTGGQLQKVCTEMPLGHTGCYLWAQRGPLRPSAAGTVPSGAAWRMPAGTAWPRGHQLLPARELEQGPTDRRPLMLKNKAGAATGTGRVIISPEQRKRKAGAPPNLATMRAQGGRKRESERDTGSLSEEAAAQGALPAGDTSPAPHGEPWGPLVLGRSPSFASGPGFQSETPPSAMPRHPLTGSGPNGQHGADSDPRRTTPRTPVS